MKHSVKKIGTGIILTILAFILYFLMPVYVSSLCLFTILCLILIFEWPPLLTALTQQHRNIPTITFTLLYPTTPFLFMIALNHLQERWLLILFFTIVFMNDVGGYFIGNLCGKHKLSRYSPNKTWEGVIGGFIFASIAAYFILWLNNAHVPLFSFFVFISLMTASSVAGDLFESYLKRTASVKDSGTLLPGHGGLLDRFDSCMFSSAVFYFLVTQSHFFILS